MYLDFRKYIIHMSTIIQYIYKAYIMYGTHDIVYLRKRIYDLQSTTVPYGVYGSPCTYVHIYAYVYACVCIYALVI